MLLSARSNAALIVAALFSALALVHSVHAAGIPLPQPDGDSLVLETPATRLVTLSPHLTELVYAAGAGDLIAATVEFSDYPTEASELPRVGDAFRIDSERIHLLEPDLILAWETGNPPEALRQLSELGFAVWVIEIRRPEEIAQTIDLIGAATGRSASAAKRAEALRRQISALKSNYATSRPVRYFYQISPQPLYTVNGEHIISRALASCGGQNVFADLAGLAPQVGLEAVLLADPTLLIAPGIDGQPDPLEHWNAWPRVRAVQAGNRLVLPADAISRATPRFIDAVELACAMLDDLRKKS